DFGAFMAALMASKPFELEWNDKAMLGVVVASDGYPEHVVKGNVLPNLDTLSAQGLDVFHAGTKLHDENFVGNGGRVILVAAKAGSLKEAQEEVYEGLTQLKWDGFFYRTDIGWRTFE
ncbi:phosphoribosylamine--glycine ligase, partial [Microvirga sp. 3-52]|nr:phosphoribosylamine--glycine ligase [Microvirga sp. 3-52]